MHTDDLIDLITTVPLWFVVAFRIYQRPNTPGKRAILGTFLVLAVAATLRLSYIERFLTDLTGLQDAAVLPKHLCVMLACTLLVGWVESVVPPSNPEPAWRRWTALKPRLTLVTAFGIAASVAFPYAAPSVTAPDGSLDFASGQYGDVAGSTHLALYLLAMAAALLPSALLCLTVARRTDDRLLRLCMRLMAAGAGIGVLYPVYRISFLIYGFTDFTYPLSEGAFHRGGSLIQLVTIVLVIVGSSVRAVEQFLLGVRRRRVLIALRPLWVDLVPVLRPDLIRDRLQQGSSDRDDRRRFRDLYGRLDERIIDISDAWFTLLPWISEDDYQRAGDIASHELGLELEEVDGRAARIAICLRVARLKAVDGEEPAEQPSGSRMPMYDDQLVNAAWLSKVAYHYASVPLAEAADRLAGEQLPQEVTA